MPANRLDPAKVQVQRKAQATMQRVQGRDRSSDRGRIAEMAVRGWGPLMRSRVRAIAVALGGDGEMELVRLIDQINEEERQR